MDVAALIQDQQRTHGVHTLVLYGSRARGDDTQESDIDLAGFADVSTPTRDARLWHGLYLDGFVYPTAMVERGDIELLKLVGGRVLLDERGLGEPLLARLATLAMQPVMPLPDHERRMRQVWARKMLARIRVGDVEAHYRRHWLLYNLLEDYFALRCERYLGPKLAFAELAIAAPDTFAAFAAALAPDAPLAALDALVAHIERTIG